MRGLIRLDKILTATGLYTRSEAQKEIRRGSVSVNGKQAISGAAKYDPETTEIVVNGELIEYAEYRYVMLNKPAGFITATADRSEKTVIQLLEERYRKIGLFAIGRLDKDAEGLLLLTNDGKYAHEITSPRKGIWKKYYVETDREMSEKDVIEFKKGIELADGTKCRTAKLEIIEGTRSAYIHISEGKYHQVKRMTAAMGKKVEYLKRISIGGLELDEELASGQYRELTEIERKECLTEEEK